MDTQALEKLYSLKEKGIITEEEFNAKKDEYLGQSSNTNKTTSKTDLPLWQYFVECISQKYCCFQGRARRKEYFGFYLGYIAVDTILSTLIFFLTQNPEIVLVFRNILTLILLLPSLGVLVRRLHDVNMSGWWILTFIVPIIMIFFKSDMKKNKYGEIPAGVIKG